VRILQVPFGFYPDPVGGTEVYVDALSRWLLKAGAEVAVAAPAPADAAYTHGPIPVFRYRVNSGRMPLRQLYGEGDPQAVESFRRVLDSWRPDIVHLHAFTSGVSTGVLGCAKQRGLPVIFTYHTPTVSCLRGTLLWHGREVCDGFLDRGRCARCMLDGHGVRPLPAAAIGAVPAAVGALLGSCGLNGGLWTALRTNELTELRHANFRRLMAEADQVVSVCEWARTLLVRNGVDPSKIVVSRQGIASAVRNSETMPRNGTATIAYLGRAGREKGLPTLIGAVLDRPGSPLRLDVYAVAQSPADRALLDGFERRSASDPRIRFVPPIAADNVVEVLRNYDALAVPSECLETGPLVVYEAFAAGIPVVGSRLGGIAELVGHEVNGLLVEAASVPAWGEALHRFATDPALRNRLRQGIRPPRSMEAAAREMLDLYRRCGQKRAAN
jgi:glycosyltransferase involved in cell wall biosynthesis